MLYDYVIVGTGPTGLTLAWYLAKLNKKILLVEKENSIGGCHRVRRVNNLFTEHGPRIYLNNYLNTITWLTDMNLNFYDIFTRFYFSLTSIGGESLSHFTILELLKMTVSYIKFMFNSSPMKKITMLEYSNQNNFSDDAKDYIDRLCRMTDGAGIDRYTLYEFFELLNQNTLYNIYQPKLPNDVGLFRHIYQKLIETKNVKIKLNTDVIKINHKNSEIKSLTISGNNRLGEVEAKKFILAIPPLALLTILKNSRMENIFSPILMDKLGYNINEWVEETKYINYIPITFHWSKKLNLKKVFGFPKTEWGVVFTVLSDYMNFDNPLSETVISTAITMPNKYSSVTNKTANESSVEELKEEVLRQLRVSFPNLPLPTVAILSPGVYFDNHKNQWKTVDSSFVFTKEGYLNKIQYKNLYNIGTHNGRSHYAFTSMESAVTNAFYLLNKLEQNNIVIKEPFTLNKLILIFLVTIIIIIVMIVLVILYRR